MHAKVYYNTVTDAIEILRKRGYTMDFNIKENLIECEAGNFAPHEFEIDEVHRYEGITDPADEAVVYGIHTTTGIKGLLVAGYGPASESMTDELVKKLTW